MADHRDPDRRRAVSGYSVANPPARARQASEIGDRALRLARDILDLDEFRDLALPGGLAKRGRPEAATKPADGTSRRQRRRSGEPPAAPGTDPSARGRRIRYEEVAFEDGSRAHSRFVSGVVQANTLHADFRDAARSADSRLAYAALMIGKESIAFNDRTGTSGDFLEKLLDFYFKLHARGRKRGRRHAADAARAEQEPLELTGSG